jgi:hypothetical protein
MIVHDKLNMKGPIDASMAGIEAMKVLGRMQEGMVARSNPNGFRPFGLKGGTCFSDT